MPAERRPLVAGNWKMNGLKASAGEIGAVAQGYDAALAARIDLLVCPPATLVCKAAADVAQSPLVIGGQDCHAKACGAHTGDISAEMLADAGAKAVILGHSERRADHHESDEMIWQKAEAAWRAGLTAIICVGETEEQRTAGHHHAVVARQVRGSVPDDATPENTVVAYEPIWAIGTGLVPTPEDVAEVHGAIRAVLAQRFGEAAQGIRILYGGSVKPDNAKALLGAADVDGALVGGASLKADDFLAIARSYL
ncbi:triose-phosphate isomerase [Azorhizobium doebereinerae]|uniref:triose-phosphate isomerase n=1 Tax=Azorhizobium doebereinerae TaxID=281091 RepID=UPI0003FB8619|nr:triose-phosphate isomerase [Azorhizobium doebereinerae]